MNNVTQIMLGELMAERTGSVDPSKYQDELFDLYSIPAFDGGTPEVVAGSAIGSTKQIVEPNDVLLSKIVPHIRRTWVVGQANGRRLIASGEWIVFRDARLDPGYLRYVLRCDSFHAQFMKTVAGVGGSLLRARPAQVAHIAVPFPPLPEQRRIAAILDQAEVLRDRRQQALKELDNLVQALFAEMFGEAMARSPRDSLASLVQEFRYGTSEKSSNSGYPALRIPNVANGYLDLSDLKTVPANSQELERLRLRDGDLLFVRTNGNPEYVGRCAVFNRQLVLGTDFDPEAFIYASYLIRARLREGAISPIVLQRFLHEGEGRRALRAVCKTSAGQYNVNTESLGGIQIPRFPKELQDAFVNRLKGIESLKASHRAALAETDKLLSALQQRAFVGAL
ncbi:restriction endonuclease subunit S [Ideonella sp. A 288]|uniref:restriction endonuclease subunit S n=1 Tax=Ideonella sp. A 288 TaxID=1962181 RepID=UPI001186B7E2|nr:restriction endonuclease subunit S [Ideonella sp. A 288]